MRKCLVSGASGYLGSILSQALAQSGWHVIELGRRPSSSNREFRRWSLGEDLPQGEYDLFLHCAWDFHVRDMDEARAVNVTGSIRALDCALKAGAKVVFVSTISAFASAKTVYGRSKFEVEGWLLERGGCVVRPGLVWGGRVGGMLGALSKAVSSMRIVPVPGARQEFYTCHIDDLASLVIHLASDPGTGVWTAASRNSISFVNLLKRVASIANRRVTFVPFEWRILFVTLRIAEALGLRSRFRSDSLLSMMKSNPTPDFSRTEKTQITFREFT